ncbi:unnamed protein product [Lampetra fluviatilis]
MVLFVPRPVAGLGVLTARDAHGSERTARGGCGGSGGAQPVHVVVVTRPLSKTMAASSGRDGRVSVRT